MVDFFEYCFRKFEPTNEEITEIKRKVLSKTEPKIVENVPNLTFEKNYSTNNTFMGVAIIFNHFKFKNGDLDNR